MSFMRGQVVRSLAGRDKDTFLVVVSADEKSLFLCDGKARPLDRPKQKNQKHVGKVDCRLTEEQLKTNKQIRYALKSYNSASNPKGEF